MKETQRRHKAPAAPLEAGLQAHLGRQLRKIYDQALAEPIPDRFKALIDALDDPETGSGGEIRRDTVSRSARDFEGDAR
jgi:hypothetical protein